MAEQRVAAPGGPPMVVRVAGVLVALEGLVATIAAILTFGRAATGRHGDYGIAICLVLLAASVFFAGIELLVGRWWPRTVVVIAQGLLFMMAWDMFTGTQPMLGVPLAIVTLTILALLFSPPSNRWMAVPFDLSPSA
ncbi:hypothetical protein [Nocardia sp. CDC160]|uniref:hypothetical protein n=1 Tax=Nocardia sp. CDC160 TaxID=3112166 RepID=UPI002DBFA000|nr:hypothetical protein [Nocardia sp. CDC160]MEC3917424.1 hypothetical protein [Nocardia sp. CDC160]